MALQTVLGNKCDEGAATRVIQRYLRCGEAQPQVELAFATEMMKLGNDRSRVTTSIANGGVRPRRKANLEQQGRWDPARIRQAGVTIILCS